MKRTLVLDDNDLVMVVKSDVVSDIDEHRGELTRTEFVNYLIQCQLHEHQDRQQYVTLAEFKDFSRQMSELVYNFLQFFISYGMTVGAQLEALARYHRSEDNADFSE